MLFPPDSEAEQLTAQGEQLLQLKAYRQACAVLERAFALWQQANQPTEALHTLRLLVLIASQQQRPLLARDYLSQALELSRSCGERTHELECLLELGAILADMGETERAIALYEQARLCAQVLPAPEAVGRALFLSGKALMEAGAMEQATPFFERAFPLLRDTASWDAEVAQLAKLVDTMRIASSVFSLLGERSRRDPLPAIAELLHEQASQGSAGAEQLAGTVSAMKAGIADLRVTFPSSLPHIEYAIANLADVNPKIRLRAARVLARANAEEAIEPLFRTLSAESIPAVQQAIAEALCAYRSPALIERMAALGDHPDPNLRQTVLLALDEQGQLMSEQQLRACMCAADEGLRARAIQRIEQRNDPALAAAVLPLLDDPAPKVRTKALYALATLRQHEALDGIIAATRDRYQQVRWAAVRVLGAMGERRAVPALIASLQDSNRDVRRSAATALGKLKDPSALDGLSAALTDDWWGVRESAQAALRKLKAAPSITALQNQLRHPDRATRCIAIRLIGEHAQQSSIPLLREQLHDSDKWVRLEALKVLALLRDELSVPAMLDELKQNDALIEVEVMKLLGDMKARSAESALIGRLTHWNPYIRYGSIQALAQLGTRESLPMLAILQLRDDETVRIDNGFNYLSLKVAAANAIRAIQAREGSANDEK